jgi:hypothetical protein
MKLVKNFIGLDGFQWWIGVIEDRNDPEKLGRCRVRVFGLHTDDTSLIPTEDLPWAIPVYSVNNNDAFSAPREGEYVVGFFLDGSFSQTPAILGVLPGLNKQNPPETRGFGDLRNPAKIRNSPKKPVAIDYPESRTGNPSVVLSGNIINDGIGIVDIVLEQVKLYVPLSLTAKQSLISPDQYYIGYNHRFTEQELKQGFVSLSHASHARHAHQTLEGVQIFGLNGSGTQLTLSQAKILVEIDVRIAIDRAKNSIGVETWDSLNIAQQSGLALHAYHLDKETDFEKSGVRSAITSGDFVKATQLIGAELVRTELGKYLRSEDTLSHVAANLFKSIPKSLLATLSATSVQTPINASGAGVGVRVLESDLSSDADAKAIKYPAPEDLNKSSINDLATLEEKTLIQQFKEKSPVIAIGANGESWSEPSPAYSAEYPYNKARETESGHSFEMDDTPGVERVHLAHRAGSFIEFYPSGTKIEKIVKNNYKIVMSDDHLYVAGRVNVVLESNANIKVVGDCYLQVENNLETKVSGSMNVSISEAFNLKANTLNFDIANVSTIVANNQYITIKDKLLINSNTSNISTSNTLTLHSNANQYFISIGTAYHKSNGIIIESSQNASINATGTGYFTSSDLLHLNGSSARITGSTVDVYGTLNAGSTNMTATGVDSNGDSHVLTVTGSGATSALIPEPSQNSNTAISAKKINDMYYVEQPYVDIVELGVRLNKIIADISNSYNIDVTTAESLVHEILNASAGDTKQKRSHLSNPVKRGTPTNAQKYLESDRIVKLRDSINQENNESLRKYYANIEGYASAFGNVKRFIAPAPKSGSDVIFDDIVGESLIIINDSADIKAWLDKQLMLASNGYWRETGVEISRRIQPSNPNIVDLWSNLGFTREYWTLSDQTPWSMAFVNYGLKQNGYRYVQTPNPKDLEIRLEDYRFTRVSAAEARSGDVVLWSNDHANFVYENNNGILSFVGGSQPPAAYENINDGRIGDVSVVDSGGASIVAILRPSKA